VWRRQAHLSEIKLEHAAAIDLDALLSGRNEAAGPLMVEQIGEPRARGARAARARKLRWRGGYRRPALRYRYGNCGPKLRRAAQPRDRVALRERNEEESSRAELLRDEPAELRGRGFSRN